MSVSICFVPRTELLAISQVRQPSFKFDTVLKGTLWIDSFNENCAKPRGGPERPASNLGRE
jgi:hypothetical protein